MERTLIRAQMMIIACYSNHIYVVEELLKVQSQKVDIDLCDSNKCTPLYCACEKGYTNISRILLEPQQHKCGCYNMQLSSSVLLLMSAPCVKRILTILLCPFWQAIYKGDAPLSARKDI
jgi:ankyrin repeat protein